MPDMTAMELEARDIAPALETRVDSILDSVSGGLFSAALAAGGLVLVPIALMAGVVGSPVIVAAIAMVGARRRRARLAGLRPATS